MLCTIHNNRFKNVHTAQKVSFALLSIVAEKRRIPMVPTKRRKVQTAINPLSDVTNGNRL